MKRKKTKLTPFVSDAEYERINANEKNWLVNDTDPIEVKTSSSAKNKTEKKRLQRSRSPSVSSSDTPANKRRKTIPDTKSPVKSSTSIPPPPLPQPSSDTNLVNFDDLDVFSPLKRESPIPSHINASLSPVLQVMTPKSSTRSRHPSSTSSTNTITTTTSLPVSVSHDPTTRIIRCLANAAQRTGEDKKLRIPM